jgi:hypothetical protein
MASRIATTTPTVDPPSTVSSGVVIGVLVEFSKAVDGVLCGPINCHLVATVGEFDRHAFKSGGKQLVVVAIGI